MQLETAEDVLEHFGVKGMKWGVRKSSSERQLKKVNRKIDRLDGNKAFQGYMLRAHYSKKPAKKALKKDPNWKYNKLSDDEYAKFNSKADNRARRAILANGASAAAIIGVGAALTLTQVKMSPDTAKGAKVAFGILGAKTVLPTIGELREVNSASKLDRLKRERDALEKEAKA